jgi:Domain of unknown function (DUF4260)
VNDSPPRGDGRPGTSSTGKPGVVHGRALVWLRLEATATAAAALALFATTGRPWWLVPALFLAPDLGGLGLLAGRGAGALTYNITHAEIVPMALLGWGWRDQASAVVAVAAIWLFHPGVDRTLGYGFKHDHDPALTHLGRHGALPPGAPGSQRYRGDLAAFRWSAISVKGGSRPDIRAPSSVNSEDKRMIAGRARR